MAKFHVEKPILDKIASHNDCHRDNLLVPTDTPMKPVIIDFEHITLDFSGIDIGKLKKKFSYNYSK